MSWRCFENGSRRRRDDVRRRVEIAEMSASLRRRLRVPGIFKRVLRRRSRRGDDDMPAHVRTALTTVNVSIPIAAKRLVLGTWQGIYLWEHRLQPHRRRVVLHFIGE